VPQSGKSTTSYSAGSGTEVSMDYGQESKEFLEEEEKKRSRFVPLVTTTSWPLPAA